MMWVVLRGGLSRSVRVSTGLALEVPGVECGVLGTNNQPARPTPSMTLSRYVARVDAENGSVMPKNPRGSEGSL